MLMFASLTHGECLRSGIPHWGLSAIIKMQSPLVGVERWTSVLGGEANFQRYIIYNCEWIDDLSAFQDAHSTLGSWSLKGKLSKEFNLRSG